MTPVSTRRPQREVKPMTSRGTLTALALTSLLVVPTVASAAIVQKWQTAAGVSYHLRSRAGDLNGDGVFDLITDEASGANVKIGVRSGATGVLMAQTALAYRINDFLVQDLDHDGIPEVIIQDISTGHYICFNLTIASGTLAVRWTSSLAFLAPVSLCLLWGGLCVPRLHLRRQR